jgi:hypothetical protein
MSADLSQPEVRQEPRRRNVQHRGTGWGHPVLVALAIVVAALFGLHQLKGLLPSLHNPFSAKTKVTSEPVLLKSLADLHVYQASQANLQEIVSREKGYDYVPSFIAGSKQVFLAAGSVQAGVDFSTIGSGDVTVDKANQSVTIDLPHATLSAPTIDVDNSHVISQSSGIVDHGMSVFQSGSAGDNSKLYQLAEAKIAAAAAADPSIIATAESNTRDMLTALVTSLGFKTVTVNFGDAASTNY